MNNGAEKLSTAQMLSALVDGEGGRDAAVAVTARWRDDPELRTRWHDYQLIGDAMRSDELAGRGRDAEFLARVRLQLDREPVPLAPQRAAEPAPVAAASTRARVRRWATPAAMAAGFVMVAGAVLVLRTGEPSGPQIAAAPVMPAPAAPATVAAPVVTVAEAPTAAAETALPLDAVLLRDARMQQYFAAHQQFGGSTALGLPSVFLRNATFETPSARSAPR